MNMKDRLSAIAERIKEFDRQTSEAESTDTGDAWNLLNWIKEEVELIREADFEAATAYLVMMGATEGKYWPDEVLGWAKALMTGEKRTGGQIVTEALTKLGKIENG
jgi:hypothetical protein